MPHGRTYTSLLLTGCREASVLSCLRFIILVDIYIYLRHNGNGVAMTRLSGFVTVLILCVTVALPPQMTNVAGETPNWMVPGYYAVYETAGSYTLPTNDSFSFEFNITVVDLTDNIVNLSAAYAMYGTGGVPSAILGFTASGRRLR